MFGSARFFAEAALLDAIPWCTMPEVDAALVKSLYSLAMKRSDSRIDVMPIPDVFAPFLERNSDVMIWRAKNFFADSDYRHATKMIKA